MMIELASEDPEFGHVATKVMEGTSPVLLSADPPEHPRQRALVNRWFTPAAIRRMEPECSRWRIGWSMTLPSRERSS